MPRFRLASFATEGLAVAADASRITERLVLQALAIGDTAAEVVALQGVQDTAALDALLRALRSALGRHYRYSLLLEGNDPHGGHPAVLSQLPIVHARSHRTLTFAEIGRIPPPDMEPGSPVFSRDCLELSIERQGCSLALFVCHFRASSAAARRGYAAGPEREQRQAEAAAVRFVIEQRFGEAAEAQWVVLGDLADQTTDERGLADPNHALGPLLDGGFAIDLAGPACARWSHYDPVTNRYCQPDHMLLSPALLRRNQKARLDILRKGLPYRADRYTGPRLPRIGWLSPAAGWHCPIAADIAFSGEPKATDG